MNFTIRDVKPEDMYQVALLKNIAWVYAYKGIMSPPFLLNRTSDKAMQSTITKWGKALAENVNQDKPFWVAENEEGTVIGFVFGGNNSHSDLPSDKELHALYVHPAMHGLGVGKALLYAFAKRMKQLGAKTFAVGCLSANKSLDFYKRMGGTILFEINNNHFEDLAETFMEYRVDTLLATQEN